MDPRRSVSLAWVVLASVFTSHVFAAVGRTPGAANVSHAGEASYSIPIFAPPGTNGMTPGLTLVYGHRNGATSIGAGWGISGLSVIARCPKIWAADGESREPRNDYSDRFCLDGDKLRLTSGTYGNAGATYQTEIETFSRVTSFGIVGNGPTHFTVVDRNGVTYEYGNTTDSRIESVGQSTVRAWALNRVRDQSGNEITFTYAEDTVNGAYRIDLIEYTGNQAQGVASPYQVDFVWEAKLAGEIDSGYMAGSLIKEVNRLDRIDVKFGATLVRRYELTYEGSLSSTMKSRLQSIQECAGSPLDCLSPTTFAYQNGSTGFGSEVDTTVSVPTTPWLIDVNGDGRDDLVYSSSTTSGSGTWMVMFANSSGGYTTPATNTGVPNINYSGAMPIDYNADGFGDLMVPSYMVGGSWWVMTGSASGLAVPFNTLTPATATGTDARAMDINADGLDDLVWADRIGYAGGDAIRYRLRTPGGPSGFSSTISVLVAPYPADQRIESGVFPAGNPMPNRTPDFNGDGRGDVVFRFTRRQLIDGTNPPQYTFMRRLQVVCAGGFSFTVTTPDAAGTPYHGDFNGDGKTDLLYLNASANIVARYSTGAGFTGEIIITALGSYASWVVLDWDHDGKDDVLLSASTAWRVARSTGQAFAAPVSLGFAGGGGTVTDVNGDGLHDFAGIVSGTWRFRLHALTEADLLLTATDGFGNYNTFSYAPLAAYGSYSKQTGAAFPLQDYAGALQVVTNVAFSDGIGGSFNLQSFYYQGARINLQGRGFLGFEYRSWIDSRDGTAQRRSYRQDFPYIGAVTNARRTQEPSATAITEVQTNYATHSYGSGFETRSLPYASQVTTYEREADGAFNGALVRTVVQTNTVDSATGVNYDTTIAASEPASGANGVQPGASYVQRTYQPLANLTPNANCLGKPQQIQEINSHNQPFGGGAITRTTDITWDTTACRPTQVVEESGNSLLQVTRALGYDAFGNINSDSVTGIGMSARTTAANWGSTGQFPTSVTQAVTSTFSQTTDKTWNYAFGAQASETDPNGIEVGWLYDDFGRRTRENRPDGTYTTWAYDSTPGWCDPRSKYYIAERHYASGGAQIVYVHMDRDAFDRPINEYRISFSGSSYESVTRSYDALGRVSSQGMPYLSAGCSSYSAPYAATLQYDLLGRPTQVSRPTSDSNPALQTTTMYYEGLTTRVMDPLSKQSTKVGNVVGGLARSIDHDGYYQNFDYDAFGNVRRVQDSLSNTLQSNTFNIRGMRTAQTDMDAGSWNFTPNALGEITLQTDAKSQNTTFVYDLLGRLTSRIEPEGTSTFTFGTSATSTPTNKNIGRLIGMAGPGYSENYTYDSLARLQQRSISSDATYDFLYTYNNEGTLDTLEYPVSTSLYKLKLKYEYQSGMLLRVKDFNAPTTVFWQANAVDAWGNIIDETLGNAVNTARGFDLVTGLIDSIYSVRSGVTHQDLSYTWNAVGSLTERRNNTLSLIETFGYDNLHRLTSTVGPENRTIAYNSMGNITSKTSVGTYTYHATKKHQVTAAGTNTYGYDANGNMNSRNGSSITWYSYNLPNTISGPSSNSSQFFYAPDRSRWKQIASYAGTSEETIYIGGLIEKATLAGVTSWRHYIAGANGAVAVYIRRSNGTTETDYLLKDHLGSLDMITRSNGTQMARISSDAWGRRRNGGTWSGNPAGSEWTAITNTTRRGFTSHEMLDNLNLTHMNGRVYDQNIGRFLSADPFIDGPGSTQGWNRYSYVHNNPLSFTDPSGFIRPHDRPQVRPDDPYPANFPGVFLNGPNPVPRPNVPDLRRDWTPSNSSTGTGRPARAIPADTTQARDGYTASTVNGGGFWRAFGNGVADFSMASVQWSIDMAESIANVTRGQGTKRDAFNIGAGYVLAGLSAIPVGGFADDAAKGTTYLYRGVHAGHPAIEAARAGRAVPGNIRGVVTAAEHNLGAVSAHSPFTAWTTDLSVARLNAGENGVILRVPTGAPPPGATWSWQWSPDIFHEGEVLLRGIREGCTVICVR